MPTSPSRPAPERIVDAAERLIRTAGFVHATTKEIAREAGCSEALLYKHFVNKEDIFLRVLIERLPRLTTLFTELTDDDQDAEDTEDADGPGARGVEERLTAVARKAADFYEEMLPMVGALLAEPGLLTRFAEGLAAVGRKGPYEAGDALTDYLVRERERGRIRADADPRAAAGMLIGACFQRAFFVAFGGPAAVQPADDFAAALSRTLWAALAPPSAAAAPPAAPPAA
ncbi:TetR family transcriptional regulator [Streptomyces sp. CNQ-509]|uniref:TetR/AcrR family transcriptional regulator n=1 Tax=Streptomyces sp. CNQ-509 TaxID=444103 RepID=UPI00062E0AA3|nr:helix-turn-helix domain-containing protein [Streptomyces sp. CNQ-509]AKH84258.1 TetR family transcriptional regulator [Streptomyces sp. CNQ-509]